MGNPRYILHATPESSVDKIIQGWFEYKEWYPTVSWSLTFETNHANRQWYIEKPNTKDELRKILVMETPKGKHIKPWYKWRIDVNKEELEVHWIPTIWAGGRMESWIYDKENISKLTPNNFKKLSKEELYSFVKKNDLKRKKTIPVDIVMTLSPTNTLNMISREIRKKVWRLKKIDFDLYIKKLSSELSKDDHILHDETKSIEEISKDLLYTTIEQEVINFIRNLYLMTVENKWYDIYKNEEKISLLERKEYKESFDNLRNLKEKVNKPDFDLTGNTELEKLNRYIRIFINKVYKEKWKIDISERINKIKNIFIK